MYHCFYSSVAAGAGYLGEVGAFGQVGEVEVALVGAGLYAPGVAVYHATVNVVHADIELFGGFAGVAEGEVAGAGVGVQYAVHYVYALVVYRQVAHHVAQGAVGVYLAMAPQVVAGRWQHGAGKGVFNSRDVDDVFSLIGRERRVLLQHHGHYAAGAWGCHRGAGQYGIAIVAAGSGIGMALYQVVVIGTGGEERRIVRADGRYHAKAGRSNIGLHAAIGRRAVAGEWRQLAARSAGVGKRSAGDIGKAGLGVVGRYCYCRPGAANIGHGVLGIAAAGPRVAIAG